MTARGDSLTCSRNPGSNYSTGLIAPRNYRPRCRRHRRRVAKFHALQVGQSPVGNYSAHAVAALRDRHGRTCFDTGRQLFACVRPWRPSSGAASPRRRKCPRPAANPLSAIRSNGVLSLRAAEQDVPKSHWRMVPSAGNSHAISPVRTASDVAGAVAAANGNALATGEIS